MKDLYKKANFPTVIDIFGEECFVSKIEHDEKFDIDILFGRPVDKTMGAKRVIITQDFKKFIIDTIDVPIKEFTGTLKGCTVVAARRKIKSNPYKSYEAWLKSKDPNKPKEITLLNSSKNPEYIEDYLGVKYIILSAKMSDKGLVFPMGVPLHKYKINDKKTKEYILTPMLAALIREYRYNASLIIDDLPFDIQTFTALKKELGYSRPETEDVNLWLSANLEKILTMTSKKFHEDYSSKVHISLNTIKTVKTSCHNVKAYANSKNSNEKKIYDLLKSYAVSLNKDKSIKKELLNLMPEYRFKSNSRAALLLYLCRIRNHSIPNEYEKLI